LLAPHRLLSIWSLPEVVGVAVLVVVMRRQVEVAQAA
jgi:hypothetical protein